MGRVWGDEPKRFLLASGFPEPLAPATYLSCSPPRTVLSGPGLLTLCLFLDSIIVDPSIDSLRLTLGQVARSPSWFDCFQDLEACLLNGFLITEFWARFQVSLVNMQIVFEKQFRHMNQSLLMCLAIPFFRNISKGDKPVHMQKSPIAVLLLIGTIWKQISTHQQGIS